MLNNKTLTLIICTFLLGACTVTGPADDGYDNSNEWGNNSRLLSDDTKTIYSSEEKQSSPAAEPEQVSSSVSDEKAEFEKFKKCDQLRAEGAESEEYQEFLQWLKFQELKAAQ